MLARFLIVLYVCANVESNDETISRVFRTVQTILDDGYPAETHHVTTYDQYILEMHRIPYGRNTDSLADRPVVFLMHGLLAASHAFTAIGPDFSLAYNLADAGFDVWMGNARGNHYSRYHSTLDPDSDIEKYAFFDFTFEEIGLYDLPAMIDYALEYTQRPKLHYIGHSQGGTVFLVCMSLRSDYNAKIASAHLLAPVGYQEYFPNSALAISAVMVDYIYSQALAMGIVELYPEFLDSLTPTSGRQISDYCTGDVQQSYMCDLFGVKHLLRNDSLEPEYIPAGASLKQAAHYGQNIRDKLFRRYHHGTNINMQIYGLEEPPLYNISAITVDVTMHYTVNDDLLDERDVLAMAADMPNAKVRKVERETFLHTDFVVALDAKELVTDYIIESLLNTPDIADETTIGSIEVIVVDHTTEAPYDQTSDSEDANTDDSSTETISEPSLAAHTVINMYLILSSLLYYLGFRQFFNLNNFIVM